MQEDICYSCKDFWDCKKPCEKVEKLLPPAKIPFHRVVTQHKYREFDDIDGGTWREKAYSLLYRLQWKEIWIANAMNVSVRTVQRRIKAMSTRTDKR